MKKKVLHPEWALAYKRKGTELRLLKGKYYLYQVTSKWNPEKKRSIKYTKISTRTIPLVIVHDKNM